MSAYRKHTQPRPKVLEIRHITREFLRSQAALLGEGALEDLDETERDRPRTRADCAGSQRPCVWMRCRHHLAIDVTPSGGIQVNHPGIELDEMVDTCALDVADRGPLTLEETGARMNVTRERMRQIEVRALITLGRRIAR